MKRIVLLLAVCGLGLTACKKSEDVAKGTTACIKQAATLFAQGSSCKASPSTVGASVKEYSFQDRLVYVFSPGNCGADEAAEVMDEGCRSIGFLGGFEGNTRVNGESFENAEFKRTIWQQ